jgi:hypothetical protein
MEMGTAPFRFHGSYVGKFEAYVCPRCKRVYFTENAYNDVMEIPLNPDEASDFSDEVLMPMVRVTSPIVVYTPRRISSANIESKTDSLDTYILSLEDRPEFKKTNKQDYDLQEVVA